ncbi:hypothetical protein CYMTET_36466, partial [Cymbomonas tetramitiformis]
LSDLRPPTIEQENWVKFLARKTLKTFLRLQLDSFETLDIHPTNQSGRHSDKQYGVSGWEMIARKAVYKGIVLSYAGVIAERIMLTWQTLLSASILDEPFPIEVQLKLNEADLSASLSSALLCSFLDDLRPGWNVAPPGHDQLQGEPCSVRLQDNLVIIADAYDRGLLGLKLEAEQGGRILRIQQWQLSALCGTHMDAVRGNTPFENCYDLGESACIYAVNVKEGSLEVRARLTVIP